MYINKHIFRNKKEKKRVLLRNSIGWFVLGVFFTIICWAFFSIIPVLVCAYN